MTSLSTVEQSEEEDWCVHYLQPDRKNGNVLFPDVFLWAHLDRGAAMRPGRSRGKVEAGRAVEKDVADAGDTVPLSPLAFNNSAEAWDTAWPLV